MAINISVVTNTEWPGKIARVKTNTALQYDGDFEKVEFWGYPALFKKSRDDNDNKTIGLFKLYLGNCLVKFKPTLPEPLTYRKAIPDYLYEMGKLIKETIPKYWLGIDFMEHVLLVLTVPDEYSENDIDILTECIFNAGLISDKRSERLQFTTELEAIAIYCMYNSLREYRPKPGTTFMIVDFGDDLATRELLGKYQLIGNSAIDLFSDKYYVQLQYLIYEFCQNVKLPFSGNNPYFSYEIDLEKIAPALLQYVTGSKRDLMEEKEWMITLDFDTVKSMFDPIIDRIIEMIRIQAFSFVKISPLCEYGDPLDRLTSDGRIHKFRRIVERNTEITIDQEFLVENLVPIYPDQIKMSFEIYYTKEQNAMNLAGSLLIDLPDVHLGTNSPCTFCLSFGDMEIKAKAFNKLNGQNYQTKFENTHSSRVI
ncbi:hypothetical protein C1646_770490 [Rhizophagus diaphanus]|nr:hypothetical protein C1646_770490 [Rhizophagus diaphanus] [Rhizophagus sp. MUCL 43196]